MIHQLSDLWSSCQIKDTRLRKCLKDWWNSLQTMTLTFIIVVRQSYDNASAIRGRYNGIQTKLVAENHHAGSIPCAGHSLKPLWSNLCVFCTVSTHRYEILTDFLNTGIRFYTCTKEDFYNTMVLSIRCNKTLVQGYHPIREALAKIDKTWIWNVKSTFWGKWSPLSFKLETGIYAVLGHNILYRVNVPRYTLYNSKLD